MSLSCFILCLSPPKALEMVGSDAFLRQPQERQHRIEMKTKLTRILRQLVIFLFFCKQGRGCIMAFTVDVPPYSSPLHPPA